MRLHVREDGIQDFFDPDRRSRDSYHADYHSGIHDGLTEEQELKIRISTRYNRICIHRKTMKAIGDPTYIHLGYRSDTKELMVLGTWVDDRKSIRVR